MSLRQEVDDALIGTWRLARLDRGAMRWFNHSVPGVWRSFLAAAICYPGFLLLLWTRLAPDDIAHAGWLRILLIESIGYVIGWTAYPLLALPFCRWLAPEDRALGFVTAYNWSQVLQTLLLVAVTVITLLPHVSLEAGALLEIAAYGLLLVYEWFIAWIALGQSGLAATALVLLDVVLGAFLSLLTQSLY